MRQHRPVPARRRALAAAPLLAAALLAGCASGDDTATGEGGTTPELSPEASLETGGTDATDGAAVPDPEPTVAETPPPPVEVTTAPSEEVVTVDVAVSDGDVTPSPDRVEVPVGSIVRVTVTSDTADELHVHGYDEYLDLPAGEPATLEFVADETGVFEVETHGSGTLLAQLQVS